MKRFLGIIPVIVISLSSFALSQTKSQRQHYVEQPHEEPCPLINTLGEHILWLKDAVDQQAINYPAETENSFKAACYDENVDLFQQQLTNFSQPNIVIIKEKLDILMELSRGCRFPQEIYACYWLWGNALYAVQQQKQFQSLQLKHQKKLQKRTKPSLVQRLLCCKAQ